jgi:hypothetical protein
MAYLDPDIAAFQAAGEMNLRKQQLEQQRLAQLAETARYDDQLAFKQKMYEEEKRQAEKEAYAKWEKEQILNQVASEMFQNRKGELTGVTDSKGKEVYRETPLSQAETYLAAAKEAARRGKGGVAQEFMMQGQKIAQAERQAQIEAEEQRLKNEKLAQEAEALRRKNEANYRDGSDVISETDKEGNISLIDKAKGEVFKVIPAAGKPAAGYKTPEDINKSEIASKALAERLIGKVDQALTKVSGVTAGTGFALTPESLETITGAKDLASDLATIKANLGFAELQAMREASPTGGALGQIAVQELVALQSTLASLDQAQSPEQLKSRLGEIKTHYQNWQTTMEGKIPKGSEASSVSGDPPPGAVRRKN